MGEKLLATLELEHRIGFHAGRSLSDVDRIQGKDTKELAFIIPCGTSERRERQEIGLETQEILLHHENDTPCLLVPEQSSEQCAPQHPDPLFL